MSWIETLNKKSLNVAEYLQKGFHAMPDEKTKDWTKRPASQHRLMNAAGMFGFFLVGGWVRDVMRGFKENGDIVEAADVPLPARWMHGILHHNPHDDRTEHQWKKVICQLIPAVFGATGAIMGSVYFFKRNGREQMYEDSLKRDHMGILAADDAAAHAQSWPMRSLAAVFATFSSASGMTLVYGLFLNAAFSFSSNRKMWSGAAELTGFNGFRKPTNTTGNDYYGPSEFLSRRVLGESESFFKRWAKTPDLKPPQHEIEELRDRLVNGVIVPLFPKFSQEKGEELRQKAKKLFSDIWQKAAAEGHTPQEVAAKASTHLADLFKDEREGHKMFLEGDKLAHTLVHSFGMTKDQLKEAVPGNNGWFGWLSEMLGAGKTKKSISAKWIAHVDQLNLTGAHR